MALLLAVRLIHQTMVMASKVLLRRHLPWNLMSQNKSLTLALPGKITGTNMVVTGMGRLNFVLPQNRRLSL
jgi:hypothetical protein